MLAVARQDPVEHADVLGLGARAGHHREEPRGEPERRVGLDERLAVGRPVPVDGDGGGPREQAHGLGLVRGPRVVPEEGGVLGPGECREARPERVHRVQAARQGSEDGDRLGGERGLLGEGLVERQALLGGRQLAADQQVGDLRVVHRAGELDQVVAADHDLLRLGVEEGDLGVGRDHALEAGPVLLAHGCSRLAASFGAVASSVRAVPVGAPGEGSRASDRSSSAYSS